MEGNWRICEGEWQVELQMGWVAQMSGLIQGLEMLGQGLCCGVQMCDALYGGQVAG